MSLDNCATGHVSTARALGRSLRTLWTASRFGIHDARHMSIAERADNMSLCCASMLRSTPVHVTTIGTPPTSPCVLVANHMSYLDPVILASQLPCVAIAKAETSSWPMVGNLMESLGVIFVRRGDPESGSRALRQAARVLRKGTSVLVYPEGTTTRGHELLPFRRGMFGIARQLDVPVVPVAMTFAQPCAKWVGDQGFASHFLELHRSKQVNAVIGFGAPIEPHTHESTSSLVRASHAALVNVLEHMPHWPPREVVGKTPTDSPLTTEAASHALQQRVI